VGPLGLAARLFGNIPYILTFQGGDVPGFVPEQTGKYFKLIMPLARWVVHKAAYAVAVGEGLCQMAAREFNRSDILYIPNGVDTNMFKPLEKKGKSDCVRILFAGRFNPQKAVHRLIRASWLLKQKGVPNFQVEIYGGGPLEQDLRTLARDLQLDDTVHFKGWINREELAKQFGMADIFSLPSDVEGMPVACLQAMACGMAIVGTKTMGIKEAVQHGENGFLVEKGDIPALADALEKLIKDPALRKNMGKKSREIVSQAYSWDAICEKYLALMRKIPGNP
jgi:glycosyltransferase involved in cell wall biosynthesis